MEQRKEFLEAAVRGEHSFTELCRRYGISRKNGYKWLNRYRIELAFPDGKMSFGDRSRRPRHSPTAIGGEISHDVERAVKRKHVSIDDEAVNQDDLELATSEAIAGVREAKAEVPKDEWWSVALDAIRKHASDDKGVLAIVDAYAHGATTRRDVLAYTKMTDRQYKAAYARMVRVSQKIDEDVREQIIDAIV